MRETSKPSKRSSKKKIFVSNGGSHAKSINAQVIENGAERKSRSKKTFPIVGIGASAGGLEAFSKLLESLPADTGMGFVLVQHLDPKHHSTLAELLGKTTQMKVLEVSDNTVVRPNQVYVIPPNRVMSISRGVLRLKPRSSVGVQPRSIDIFFQSLAEDQRDLAIGIILSGTAT